MTDTINELEVHSAPMNPKSLVCQSSGTLRLMVNLGVTNSSGACEVLPFIDASGAFLNASAPFFVPFDSLRRPQGIFNQDPDVNIGLMKEFCSTIMGSQVIYLDALCFGLATLAGNELPVYWPANGARFTISSLMSITTVHELTGARQMRFWPIRKVLNELKYHNWFKNNYDVAHDIALGYWDMLATTAQRFALLHVLDRPSK